MAGLVIPMMVCLMAFEASLLAPDLPMAFPNLAFPPFPSPLDGGILSSHHPLPKSGTVIIDTTCCLKDEL